MKTWVVLVFFCNCYVGFSQEVYIPDPNLLEYLVGRFDTDMDGSISVAEAEAVDVGIDVSGNNISDLTGIESFPNMTRLVCRLNNLEVIPDLSGLMQMWELNFSLNNVTVENILGLPPNLRRLNLAYNPLPRLPDISNLARLEKLEVYFCGLVELPDMSNHGNMLELICSNNALTSLPDLSGMPQLTRLTFSDNQITSLPDLSALSELENVHGTRNMLTILPDLGSQGKLESLTLRENRITHLPDLSSLVSIIRLELRFNLIEEVPDLSALVSLRILELSDNLIHSIEIPPSLDVGSLSLSNNCLTELSLNGLTSLTGLRVDDNSLNSLDGISTLTSLVFLSANNTGLTEVPNFTLFPNLMTLRLAHNQLPGLNVSNVPSLKRLDVSHNLLTRPPRVPTSLRDELEISMNLFEEDDCVILNILSAQVQNYNHNPQGLVELSMLLPEWPDPSNVLDLVQEVGNQVYELNCD